MKKHDGAFVIYSVFMWNLCDVINKLKIHKLYSLLLCCFYVHLNKSVFIIKQGLNYKTYTVHAIILYCRSLHAIVIAGTTKWPGLIVLLCIPIIIHLCWERQCRFAFRFKLRSVKTNMSSFINWPHCLSGSWCCTVKQLVENPDLYVV